MTQDRARRAQSGNVMFYIFAAIALLAALTFAVSQGSRGSINSMTEDRARLFASEIMAYGDAVAKAAQALRLRGVPLNMLSFDTPGLDDYENPNCTTADCRIYSPAGGGVNYTAPATEWLDSNYSALANYARAFVDGTVCVPDVGTGGPGCRSDAVDNEELVVFVPYIKRDVCLTINRLSGIDNPGNDAPQVSDCAFGTKFTGAFADGVEIDAAQLRGKPAGCVKTDNSCGNGADAYHYYHVMIAR